MLEELRQLKRGPGECRRFAWVLTALLTVAGGWLAVQGMATGPWLLGAVLPVLLVGILSPTLLRGPYLVWMGLGLFLGTVVSTALLSLFFYLVLTPTGLLARLAGRDFLDRKGGASRESHWKARHRKPSRESYERQF